MQTFSKFEIIGHVGNFTIGERVSHLSIAANYPRKDKTTGEWSDDVHWNRVTLLFPNVRKTAEVVAKGDLVRVAGRMRDTSYEKDGDTIYTCERIVDEFDIYRPAGTKIDADKQGSTAK